MAEPALLTRFQAEEPADLAVVQALLPRLLAVFQAELPRLLMPPQARWASLLAASSGFKSLQLSRCMAGPAAWWVFTAWSWITGGCAVMNPGKLPVTQECELAGP